MRKIGRNELCSCGSGKKYKKCCMIKKTTAINSEATNTEAINHTSWVMNHEIKEERDRLKNDPRPNVIYLGDGEDFECYYLCGICEKEFSTNSEEDYGCYPKICPHCNTKFILGDDMCISDDTEFEVKGHKYKIYDKDGFGNHRCPIDIVRIS